MRLLALPLLALLSIGPSSCQLGEETGFVEMKREFQQVSSGTYRLNGEDVTGLAPTAANTSVVVRKKTGPIKVEFVRDRTYELCTFQLRKNRIATVTLYLENREIRCSVQL
jgi:hypothetical protein